MHRIIGLAQEQVALGPVDKLYVDTSYLKVNVNCNRNIDTASVGVSRAGKTTKISIVADQSGCIHDVIVAPGNASDITLLKDHHLNTVER